MSEIMKFQELVSSVKEYGISKEDLIIIIPSFARLNVLQKHLEFLQAQTYKKFNVIAVLGNNYDDAALDSYLKKKKFDFGVIVAKRKEDTGSAGGFYTGQKYALEREYPFHILADDDCFPTENDVVESLYAARSYGYVAPRKRYISSDHREKVDPNHCVAQYTLFSLEIMKKHGLYYAPLYTGGDDGEYQVRVGGSVHLIDKGVEHITSSYDFYRYLDKNWAYAANGFMSMSRPWDFIYAFFRFYVHSLAALVAFFPPYGRKIAASFLSVVTRFKFGKEPHEKIRSDYRSYIFEEKEISGRRGFRKIDFPNDLFSLPISRKAPLLLFAAAQNIRKEVMVKSSYSDLPVALLGMVSKKAYLQVGWKKWLLFADNGSLPLHVLRLLLFVAMLPLLALYFVVVLIPIKLLRQPNTERYGLD